MLLFNPRNLAGISTKSQVIDTNAINATNATNAINGKPVILLLLLLVILLLILLLLYDAGKYDFPMIVLVVIVVIVVECPMIVVVVVIVTILGRSTLRGIACNHCCITMIHITSRIIEHVELYR